MNTKEKTKIKNKTCEASIAAFHMSPRKVNLVAELIRGKKAGYADNILNICCKKAAPMLLGVLRSAVANAEHNLSLNIDSLVVETVDVGKSFTAKRLMPRARAKTNYILKRYSRVRIILKQVNIPVTQNSTLNSNVDENLKKQKSILQKKEMRFDDSTIVLEKDLNLVENVQDKAEEKNMEEKVIKEDNNKKNDYNKTEGEE